MRVLIPTVDYPPIEGGISTVTLHVSRELAALGHEVTVVAPAFPEMAEFDRNEPARVVRFGGYTHRPVRFARFMCAAWPCTRQADLVLAINVAYGGLLARAAYAMRGTPYIAFAYAYEFLKFVGTPAARLLRGVYAHAAATAAISTFTRHNLRRFGVPDAKIALVRPGANPAAPAPDTEVRALLDKMEIGPGPIVLAVGRFIPRKGQLRLVRAMSRILENCPNTTLVMVGRGPTRADCLALAQDMGIAPFVQCPGCLSDREVALLYQACSVFALPTGAEDPAHVEGFGLVFTEAHAHGKPVVAGRSGGVPDAVLDGETGLLVPPEDMDALAAAIIRLLNDPALAAQLGAAGRARVEAELNWACFTRRLLEAAGVMS